MITISFIRHRSNHFERKKGGLTPHENAFKEDFTPCINIPLILNYLISKIHKCSLVLHSGFVCDKSLRVAKAD